MGIAAVLIVKNEEGRIKECLESVQWADEIVVLDSGSKDQTTAIARKYTDKVFIVDNWEGYGRQRQRAQGLAESKWIFMIDADERVTPELETSIRTVVKKEPTDTVYSLDRLSWVFGRFIRHSGWYPDKIVRLYPKALANYDDALVHEKAVYPTGTIVRELKGDLIHYPYRNLRHYLEKSAEYAQAWADAKQRQGKRASLMQGLMHGIGCFVQMYVIRKGFLDGRQGFLLAALSCHSTFVKYADLWIRNHQKKHVDQDRAFSQID